MKKNGIKYYGFLKFLLDNEIGIIQLPCPELKGYGPKKDGGQVKRDNMIIPIIGEKRGTVGDLFEPVLEQILEYQSNGFEIVSLMGIYGAPLVASIELAQVIGVEK